MSRLIDLGNRLAEAVIEKEKSGIGTMKEYRIYKVVIFVNDLVSYRFRVAAENRTRAQKAGQDFMAKRGMTDGFNCRVSVMLAYEDRQPATIMVAQ